MPDSVVQELIDKTFRELETAGRPTLRSRISQSPNAYIHLVAWSNASLLRIFCRLLAEHIPYTEKRTKPHLKDSARSVLANIEEGFRRPTTSQYLDFLGYSQGSLEEIKGDVRRLYQDGMLPSRHGLSLASLGIDLKAWHEALKRSTISREPSSDPAVYTAVADAQRSFQFGYPPVDRLTAITLSYEVFLELINKTDWHLRRLVASLENKLSDDQKSYQVEKARTRIMSWKK